MLRTVALGLAATAAFACSVDYLIWIPRDRSADPLYRFVRNGMSGYIDQTGQIIIAPKFRTGFNFGGEFHDGLLEIGASNGVYADRTGKVVIDRGLERGWDFSEGLAVAMRKGENLWGYIDTSGEFAISPRFATGPNDYVWSFSDGLAMIEANGKYGFIDHSGRFVIQPLLPDATSFSDGLARVVVDGPCFYFPDGACGGLNPVEVGGKGNRDWPACKFSYIDKNGRVITAMRFDFARDFSEGVAPVRIGNLWGLIDAKGAIVVNPKFDDAEIVSSGLSRVRQQGLYGYVDKSGSMRIIPQYRYAEDFSEGFAVVGDGSSKYWYIDKDGNRTIPGEFSAASKFFKGLAQVRFRGGDPAGSGARFAYINSTGRQVFAY